MSNFAQDYYLFPSPIPPEMEELQRKNKELDGLVTYLRSVIETKDGKISDLEHQLQSMQ